MPMECHPLNPDACVACTLCLVHCPVAQASPNFLGPRMVGPAYERFRLLGLGEEESLHYCSNCKNCDIACPHDVPISAFNMRARAAQCKRQRPPLRDWILGHGECMAKMLRYVPSLLKNVGMLNPLTRKILGALGISPQAPLPAFAPHSFRSLYKKEKKGQRAQTSQLPLQGQIGQSGQSEQSGQKGQAAQTAQITQAGQTGQITQAGQAGQTGDKAQSVVFFPGCYIDIYDPQSGLDMLWLLRRAGYEVLVPDGFVCCGLPMVANGFWEDARKNATKNHAILQEYARQGIPVLTGCPSCALMFNVDIPEYFPELACADRGALPQRPSMPVMPVMEDAQAFLWDCVTKGRLNLEPQAQPAQNPDKKALHRVVYHAPCHLRAQGAGLPGLELLRALPQVEVTYAQAGCCGIAGSYGFKKEKYPIGMQVGAALFALLRHSGAQCAASECGTCRVQMRHGSGLPSLHPVSIVRQILERNDAQALK